MEYYKRQQVSDLWQIYVAKCVSVGIDKDLLPEFSVLRDNILNRDTIKETPQQVVDRIIGKINRANGGDDL